MFNNAPISNNSISSQPTYSPAAPVAESPMAFAAPSMAQPFQGGLAPRASGSDPKMAQLEAENDKSIAMQLHGAQMKNKSLFAEMIAGITTQGAKTVRDTVTR